MHRRCLCAALALVAGIAHAAGGHHAVDDAVILEAGQCQLETWADAYRGARGSWHLGPACRVGAWELGLNIDAIGVPSERAYRGFAPQAKWARKLADKVAIGIVLTPSFVDGRYASFQPLVPLTWEATRELTLHVNAGRDLPRGGGRGRNLAGASAEWTPTAQWSFVAERWNDLFGHSARVGLRWQPDPLFSIDVSHARAIGDSRGQWWTIGATYVIQRR